MSASSAARNASRTLAASALSTKVGSTGAISSRPGSARRASLSGRRRDARGLEQPGQLDAELLAEGLLRRRTADDAPKVTRSRPRLRACARAARAARPAPARPRPARRVPRAGRKPEEPGARAEREQRLEDPGGVGVVHAALVPLVVAIGRVRRTSSSSAAPPERRAASSASSSRPPRPRSASKRIDAARYSPR